MNLGIEKRDIIAVILVPTQLLIGWGISVTPIGGTSASVVLLAIIQAICVYILCFHLYREMLKQDWVNYNKKLWLKILLAIIGVVVLHILIYLVRQILPAVDTESLASTSNEDPQLSTGILLFGTMLPLLAPFLEEIVFRYVLFFKFIKYKFIAPILFIISSILFGVVHFNNFDGNLFLTIPFMVTGAYFALIYYFTKNIWYSISVHFISNFALSLLPVLFILVMQIFTTN